jgi:hypothetical protein
MRKFVLAGALSLAALSSGALVDTATAQTAPAVTVGVGQMLAKNTEDFGAREVDGLRKDLGDEITHALKHNPAIARVDLVIEDAKPNRPTFDQLSRTIGLSMTSIGVGGARISGTVTMADGSVRPIRYQWYETDLHNDRGASTWFDADKSFGYLADELRNGKAPDKYTGPGPTPNGGHFGYPFNGE